MNIVLLTVSSVACFLIDEFVLRALGYHGVVSSNGGFNPAVRRRSRRALTLAEREEILRGLAAASSILQVSARLGRAPAIVSREITRCGGAHTSSRH